MRIAAVLVFLVACGEDVIVDPAVVIDERPGEVTNEATARIAFHAEGDEVAAFTCTLDGDALAPCESPLVFDVDDGAHTVTITAGGDPATVAWAVDTVAPETTIDDPPGALEAQASQTVAFSSDEGGDQFECSIDDGAFAACTSPATLDGLIDGAHTFAARAIDAAGNVDATPATAAWSVDTVPPVMAVLSGPSGPTSTATPTFVFTAGDATAIACAIDAGVFASCTSPFASSTLAQGAHDFTVRGSDAAGNAATATRSFTVDTLAPTVSVTSGPSGLTNLATPMWTFDTGGAPVSVECRVDLGAFASCVSPFVASTLGEGAHNFNVRATDAAANVGLDSRAIVVDTIAPTLAFDTGPSGLTTITSPIFTFTTGGSPAVVECRVDGDAFGACTTATSFAPGTLAQGEHQIDVRVKDAATNSRIASRSIVVDSVGPTVTITAGPTGLTNTTSPVFTFTTAGTPTVTQCRFDTDPLVECTAGTFSATLGQGPHVFGIVLADEIGNPGGTTQSFSVDSIAPTVAITGGPTGVTANQTPTFTFDVFGTPSVTECRIDIGLYTPCAATFTTSSLGQGLHTFEVQVTDAATNHTSGTRSFTVDTQAPTISIVSGPSILTNDDTPTFGFTAGTTAATITCAVDGDTPVDCSAGTFTTAPLDEASHTFAVEACTAAAICANDSRTFTVDVTAPAVAIDSGPAEPTPTKDSTPLFTFTVDGTATAIQCRVRSVAIPDPPFIACAGSFTSATLGDGAYTFEVVATDAATNPGAATRAFTVDTAPPTVSVTGGPSGPDNLVPLPVFTFDDGDAVSSTCAIGGDAPVDCSVGAFAIPLAYVDHTHEGPRTFTVTATDAAGNVATATRDFVIDTIKPVVSIAGAGLTPPTVDTTPEFTFTVSPGGTAPVALRCSVDGAPFATCTSPFTTGTLGQGNHTIDVEAEDPAGNVGPASRAFAVDALGPSVTIIPPTIESITSLVHPLVFFSINETATATCSADGGTPVACDGTAGFGVTLPQGAHVYTIVATDPASNIGTGSASFTVDSIAPTIAIDDAPPSPTTNDSPTFSFTAGIDATSVRCTLDTGQVIDPCASPVMFVGVAPGPRTFTVTVHDAALPVNPRSAQATFLLTRCGDGVGAGAEVCDGLDLRGNDCADVGLYDQGTPLCNATCTGLLQGTCSRCGDGVTEGNEQCEFDGAGEMILNGQSCLTVPGTFDSGALGCTTTTCQFNTSGCGDCGDHVKNGTELCDDHSVGAASCSSLGEMAGTLGCAPSCAAYDTYFCNGGFVAQSTGLGATTICDQGLSWGGSFLAACTEDVGVWKMPLSGATAGTWINMNGQQNGVKVTNLHGYAVYAQGDVNFALFYTAPTVGTGLNGYRSNQFAAGTAASMQWPTGQSGQAALAFGGFPVHIFAVRGGGAQNTVWGGWNQTLGAAIQHGNNSTAAVTNAVGAGVTGTVTAIAAPCCPNGGNQLPTSDLQIAVYGKDLNDNAATGGGVYWACDLNGTAGGHFRKQTDFPDDVDTDGPGPDIDGPDDDDLVFSVTPDNSTYSATASRTCPFTGTTVTGYATTWYAALRGGGAVWKTTDAGVTWSNKRAGIPAGVEVFQIAEDCQTGTAGDPGCGDPLLLYAATSNGLYKSVNGADSWTLDGLEGQVVRSVQLFNRTSPSVPTRIFVGVDDAVRIYSRP